MNIFKRIFCNKWEKKYFIGIHRLCSYGEDRKFIPGSEYSVAVWLWKKKYTEDYKLIARNNNRILYFDYEFWKLNKRINYLYYEEIE